MCIRDRVGPTRSRHAVTPQKRSPERAGRCGLRLNTGSQQNWRPKRPQRHLLKVVHRFQPLPNSCISEALNRSATPICSLQPHQPHRNSVPRPPVTLGFVSIPVLIASCSVLSRFGCDSGRNVRHCLNIVNRQCLIHMPHRGTRGQKNPHERAFEGRGGGYLWRHSQGLMGAASAQRPMRDALAASCSG